MKIDDVVNVNLQDDFDIPAKNSSVGAGSDPIEGEKLQGLKLDFSFLLSVTGQGSIEERMDHPLNFLKSRGLAQVLRGLEGLLGQDLKLALVDIVIGVLNFTKERRAAANG